MDVMLFAFGLSGCLAAVYACWTFAVGIRRTAVDISAAHDRFRAVLRLADDFRALEERLDALEASQKRLIARVGMREVRDQRRGKADGRPDWRTDPAGFLATIHRERGLPPPATNGGTSE